MNWIQLKAYITPGVADAFEESMLAAGASAVTMQDAEDDPLFEPPRGTTPLWKSTIITSLFSADDDIEEAKSIAKAVFGNLSSEAFPDIQVEILENEDWTRKWIENFKPIRFGQRLWVCPSWTDTPDPNAVNLMLDPGLAFGTGTHATTSLCLQWLDQANLQGKTVIDFGCGSGILGIAALLLGADKVIAIDHDPQALIATKDNAERNQIDLAKIETYLPEDAPADPADIMLANILAQPLYELRDKLASLTKPSGSIVLSGILNTQAEDLRAHYCDLFEMDPIAHEEDWTRLTGYKK